MACFIPTARPRATPGVWQNRPMLTCECKNQQTGTKSAAHYTVHTIFSTRMAESVNKIHHKRGCEREQFSSACLHMYEEGLRRTCQQVARKVVVKRRGYFTNAFMRVRKACHAPSRRLCPRSRQKRRDPATNAPKCPKQGSDTKAKRYAQVGKKDTVESFLSDVRSRPAMYTSKDSAEKSKNENQKISIERKVSGDQYRNILPEDRRINIVTFPPKIISRKMLPCGTLKKKDSPRMLSDVLHRSAMHFTGDSAQKVG